MDWQVEIVDDRVKIGKRFYISFQRTLRLPDDDKSYPLPPALGLFPVRLVSDFADKAPPAWLERGGVFFPMYQREAMWLAFETPYWKPCAVKIGLGGINALTGAPWQEGLRESRQNYLVCPDQPWLDGINAGDDTVRQFVAMPLGLGYTVEGQLTGEEQVGGLQIQVYDPKPGLFPDEPPPEPDMGALGGMGYGPVLNMQAAPMSAPMASPAAGMGIAAGGQMKQKIYPDPHGLEAWDQGTFGELFVHIVNSEQYHTITGEAPPESLVDARTYTQYGFPWFELYDEDRRSLAASDELAGVSTVREIDEQHGGPHNEADTTVDIDPDQIRKIDRQEKPRRD